MSELLTVIARVRAKAGQESRLRRELLGLVAATRAETGCVSYVLHESNGEPGSYLFYEVWKTEADLNEHFQTPHMLALSEKVPDLVEGTIDLTKWTEVK